jgi:multidrug efflux pump subunit AcrA (membrane-fusion protein)
VQVKVTALRAGKVKSIEVAVGARVVENALLIRLD